MEIIKLKRNTRKQPLAFLQRVFALLLFPVERTVTSMFVAELLLSNRKMAAPYTAVNRRGLVFSSNLNTITHMRCFRRGITSSNKIQKQLTDICVASFSCFCVCVVYTYDFKNWFYERSKNATLIRFVLGKQWKQNKNNVSIARRFDRGSVEERNLKKRKNRRCTINIVAALLYKLL